MSYEINEDMARRAHEMRSDREYVPGSATAEYQRQVDEARRIAEEVKAQCKTTAQRNRVDGMLDKYERTLAFYINRDNEIGTWCPSILIAGGSNFPVKKKERQNDAWRANLANYDKAVELLDNIRDYGHNAPISSRDPEALTALRKKLERVKGQHEHMKAVNLFYRENDTLDGCPDIGPLEKAAIEGRMQQWNDRKPYLTWQIENVRKQIQQIEKRIAEMEAAVQENAQPVAMEDLPGVTYHENSSTMRVQLIFDGKPEPDIRAILKSHAFKWCPSQGAWQRQLTANGKRAAREVLAQIRMLQNGGEPGV